METVAELDEQIQELVSYMQSKIKAKDWHAVMDAAADIRELEAEIRGMQQVNHG